MPFFTDVPRTLIASLLALPLLALADDAAPPAAAAPAAAAANPALVRSCFLLYEIGVGERRRNPAEACAIPLTPGATFQAAQALAGLDAGVVKTVDEDLSADAGKKKSDDAPASLTLATAMRNSTTAAFQTIAQRLGNRRQQGYLDTLAYGNMDAGNGVSGFWVGGPLQISPEQQLEFFKSLYQRDLPVRSGAALAVRQMLVQPSGVVTAQGQTHAFNAPWAAETEVSTVSASATDASGAGVRWLVGRVQRGKREYVFVSCVTGPVTLDDTVAITLAARALREEGVL